MMSFNKRKFWNLFLWDSDNAMRYLNKNKYGSIFRYRNFDCKGYNINALKNQRMYLSNPESFNDPWDCRMGFNYDTSNSLFFENSDKELEKMLSSVGWKLDYFSVEHKKLLLEEIDKGKQRLTSDIDYVEQDLSQRQYEFNNDTFRVACFSEINNSILMWSHYADYHKGFCIEYDIDKLKDFNEKFNFIYPVNYGDTPFSVNGNQSELGVTREYAYSTMCKSELWNYEKEWRLVLPKTFANGNDVDGYYIETPKPKCIYLGVKICKNDEQEILGIKDEQGFEVKKMQMKLNEYQLFC